MGYSNNVFAKKPERNEAVFFVFHAVVQDRNGRSIKQRRQIREVDAVLAKVLASFRLIPTRT